MKTNRELDAKMAEVMGWKIIPYVATGEKGPALVASSLPNYYRKWPGDKPWRPSEDLEAAWEVLEAVFPKEVVLFKQYDTWYVGESVGHTYPDGSIDTIGQGDTLTLAICKAVLNIKGMKI